MAACRGARRRNLYNYYGISYDATARGAAGAARTSAEDLGTTTGAATTGRHPDTGRRAHDDRGVTTGAAVTPAPISRPA